MGYAMPSNAVQDRFGGGLFNAGTSRDGVHIWACERRVGMCALSAGRCIRGLQATVYFRKLGLVDD